MDKEGVNSVGLSGSDDKMAITATWQSHWMVRFFHFNQSFPKFKFPYAFSLSVNEKHFGNRIEAMKYLQEVIIPYVKEECKKLELLETQKALFLFDVFRDHTVAETMGLLEDNNGMGAKVPGNMTQWFQPVEKFGEWFSEQIHLDLDKG